MASLVVLIALGGIILVRAASAAPGDAQVGQVIYTRLCVSCHGATGQGGRMAAMLATPPRNLADQTYMSGRSEQQLFEVIQRGGAAVGLSSDMGAFGAQLNAQQIWDTVAYVRTLAASASSPAASAPAATPAAPPADLSIARLRLSIWPEYDDPRVLVILRGEMAPSQAFPTRVVLPIPKGAEIIGAGMISEQNALLVHPHQIVPGEGQDRLEINLPVPRFFVELYYAPFTTTTPARRFVYPTPATYPITVLEVDIQQPLRATDFALTPAPMERSTDEQGLTYHQFVYHHVAQGQGPTFTIAYTKTGSTPSVPKKPSQQPPSPQRARTQQTLVSLSLLAGAMALFAGWVWLARRAHALESPAPPASAPSVSLSEVFLTLVQEGNKALETSTSPAMAPQAQMVNFCASCGRKLLPDDRFCAGCGKPIQR